jgi:hypothetical protein
MPCAKSKLKSRVPQARFDLLEAENSVLKTTVQILQARLSCMLVVVLVVDKGIELACSSYMYALFMHNCRMQHVLPVLPA